jgi:hypothetical protein
MSPGPSSVVIDVAVLLVLISVVLLLLVLVVLVIAVLLPNVECVLPASDSVPCSSSIYAASARNIQCSYYLQFIDTMCAIL